MIVALMAFILGLIQALTEFLPVSSTGHLIVAGKQGHVAYPQRAENPIRGLVTIIEALQAEPLDAGTAQFAPSHLEFTSVDVGNQTVNPCACELRVGNAATTVGYFYFGDIDEVRVSRSARYTANFARPTAPPAVDGDAFVLGQAPRALAGIAQVLGPRAEAQIASAVVGAAAVGVIDVLAGRRLHDLPVHVDGLSVRVAGGVAGTVERPFVLAEPLVVGGVHVGIQAVSQRNQADIALGYGGLAPVVPAGDAGDLVQPAGPPGVVGAPRQDRLAQAHRAKPRLRVADGIHAIVTTRSRHDFSLLSLL